MPDLHKLKNIGLKTSQWLYNIDITSIEQIEELGAAEVYHRLKTSRGDVSLNAL